MTAQSSSPTAIRRDFFATTLSPSFEFSLDAHCMDLPADWPAKYGEALGKAHAAMVELEAGAIANPDEKRMVGHYWMRAPERAPSAELRSTIVDCLQKIHSFTADVHNGRRFGSTGQPLKNVLVIGIGGSALGPQLAAAALGSPNDRMRPFFFDNTDPDGMDRVLNAIAGTPAGLAGTLVVVISKSGGTKETRNGQLYAHAAFTATGLDFVKHAVAVTGDGSELWNTATKDKWLAIFPMWDWIGGRTSELSAVGLLPAALQGVDIAQLLAGAAAMDELTRGADPRQNPAMLMAVAWHSATGGKGQKDMVILPYKDRFELFSRYLQQLVMESLGKEHDLHGAQVNQGISVYGNKGSTDQHAYVQQLRDGVNNFFATFIEVQKDREFPGVGPVPTTDLFVEEGATPGDYLLGFLLGTQQALHEKGRKSVTLTVTDCSPFALGVLIALYERTVGIYAQLVGINAYHQPGVEAGKKAAAVVLKLQRQLVAALSSEPRTAAELAATCQGDAFTAFKILDHLSHNGRVKREPAANDPLQTRYSKL